MNTFHFDPSRIRDPLLRAEAIYWHYLLLAKQNRAAPAVMRLVESEGSDDIAEKVAEGWDG
jgi:hypothetical protein